MKQPFPTIRISSNPEDLHEGLFGQVFLWILEILPFLYENKIFPDWRITAHHYGQYPECLVIPGVLDLAYRPSRVVADVSLLTMRRRHCLEIGNDFNQLNMIWSSFFTIPARIKHQADGLGSLEDVLGLHFRGTDKNQMVAETNPISYHDFLVIIKDFLSRRPDLRRIFLATDDRAFHDYLCSNTSLDVLYLGHVPFHKLSGNDDQRHGKADRALLDCLLLSRCRAVLKTCSALSAFSKILEPRLEIYRCSACKKYTDIPYVPVAYIEPYTTDSAAVLSILARLMKDDWREVGMHSSHTSVSFSARPRRRRSFSKRVFDKVRYHYPLNILF